MIEYTVKVYDDGHKVWYLNGELHREDGPAKEWPDGSKEWYRNNQLHREDGPAVEMACGYKEWWINGKLHSEDRPARIYPNGDKFWLLNGKYHRVDGPALEYANGTKFWYLDGKELTEEEFNRRTRKHSIVIDGETIEISEESYQKMKESLTSQFQFFFYISCNQDKDEKANDKERCRKDVPRTSLA